MRGLESEADPDPAEPRGAGHVDEGRVKPERDEEGARDFCGSSRSAELGAEVLATNAVPFGPTRSVRMWW